MTAASTQEKHPTRRSRPATARRPETPDAADTAALASVQAAFEIFERQSRQLETAYRALEQDLARSNSALQERNRELTAKNQELHQVTRRLESVLESLTDGLLVIGMDGQIERCNQAAARLLERSQQEAEQARFLDLISIPDADALLTRVLRGDSPVLDHPWILRQPDGSVHNLLFSLAPVTGSDKNILGAICNLRDITEIRRLEKRLQSHERLAALGEMAASVAHEIRNPLGTIEGFARLLRRDLADMPAPLQLAERIVAGAQNLNYVITNLLTYARPMRLMTTDIPVATLFEYCRETLEDRASRANVSLTIEFPSPSMSLRCDHRQVMQALLNLGINAIEACQPSQTVHISATQRPASVILHIRDTGCGMPPDQVAKVFDPFFTTKEGGTGLGLSLTRKIIDMHGGDIAVASVPGEGTEFTIELAKKGVGE